jgi:hypothetical protein
MKRTLTNLGLAGLVALTGCGFPGTPGAIRYWQEHPEELRMEQMKRARGDFDHPERKLANFFSGGLLGVVAGAHHAGVIRDYDAARKAILMGRGLQVIGSSGEGTQPSPATQPYQQPGQARPRGAWVTDLNVDLYSFLWTDRNGNGTLDWILVGEVGERATTFRLSRDRAGLCLNIMCAQPSQPFSIRLREGDRVVSESSSKTNDIGGFLSMFPVNFAAPGHYTVDVAFSGTEIKRIGVDVTP